MVDRRGDVARASTAGGAGMKQQATFAEADWTADARKLQGEYVASFLLGRAIAILEGLVESPTDAIDMELARDLLADYRKWMES